MVSKSDLALINNDSTTEHGPEEKTDVLTRHDKGEVFKYEPNC